MGRGTPPATKGEDSWYNGSMFKPIPGYPKYQVSEDGTCLGQYGQQLKPYRAGRRYLRIRLCMRGVERDMKVHHAVLLAFVGPQPSPRHWGRHLDDNPSNNHHTNLAWGLPVENSADAIRNGGLPWGEAKADARLTVDQVRAIRLDNRASRVVGAEYGVSHTAILRIRRGERWIRA